jgi:nucleoid-associated protein YgaU
MSSPHGPTTAREALLAELLGDVGVLLKEADRITERADADLARSSAGLDAAADRFRAAVNLFSEEAKQGISDYARRRTAEAGSLAVEELRGALEAAAADSFRGAAGDLFVTLEKRLRSLEEEQRKQKHRVIAASLTTATLSTVFTAGLLHFLGR